MNYIRVVIFLILQILSFPLIAQSSGSISVTDIAGRTITLDKPAQKLVLGEGRFMAALGVLGVSDPVSKVAGMMNDFRLYDPNTFSVYAETFPAINDIPTFGHTTEDSVSVEKIILLNPDVAIFGLEGHGPGARSHHITDKLQAAGIPIVFIDFRADPIKNTGRSVEILGAVLGLQKEAIRFSEYYSRQLELVRSRVSTIPKMGFPKVLLDLRVDNAQACCYTVTDGLFASMAEFAGARNLAKDVLSSRVGQLSLEYVLTADFDIYIGTAYGNPSDYHMRYERILSGVNVKPEQARNSLLQTMQARGLSSIDAARNKKSYALWHHFYNSPLNLYAIQKMATWFHPKVFEDIEPEATLKKLLDGFKPLDLMGEYSASL